MNQNPVRAPGSAAQFLRPVLGGKLAQQRFQCVDELAQLVLIVAPEVNGLGVDGLAHLLGTGGVDGALGFVEAQAAFFPG